MADFELEFDNGPILVDLTSTGKSAGLGYKDAGKSDEKREDDERKSDEAINHALQTIYRTAGRLSTMLNAINDHDNVPGKVEIEFGLALKEDSQVMITKFGGETHWRVKLTWKMKDDD